MRRAWKELHGWPASKLRLAEDADAAVDCCAAEKVALVLTDLSTPALDILSLVQRLRGGTGFVLAIVAFGPHVHEESLAAAKSSGM